MDFPFCWPASSTCFVVCCCSLCALEGRVQKVTCPTKTTDQAMRQDGLMSVSITSRRLACQLAFFVIVFFSHCPHDNWFSSFAGLSLCAIHLLLCFNVFLLLQSWFLFHFIHLVLLVTRVRDVHGPLPPFHAMLCKHEGELVTVCLRKVSMQHNTCG